MNGMSFHTPTHPDPVATAPGTDTAHLDPVATAPGSDTALNPVAGAVEEMSP